jgi:4-diphosphocytidyl-2-C-methyl-D-erythritol kinase
MTALIDSFDRPEPMRAVTVRVPAKVNLALSVGPRRADGYHDLVTVFHAVSLYDEVTAEPGEALEVVLIGDHTDGVPAGPENLAARAAVALAGERGVEPSVRLTIRKGIPVAGGMAGGSADAAAALVACDALWQTGCTRDDLHEIASTLGSDVPFLLYGGTAIGTGRGERLTPALTHGEFHWVFALADGGLSTPEVYAACDRLRGDRQVPQPTVDAAMMAALRAGDPRALAAALHNDLEPAALSLHPALRATLRAGREAGALGGLVSGSGPTCAFLARDADAALDVAVALTASGTCRTVRRAHGPAAGAHVVG